MLLTLFERVIVEADSALESLVANPPADLKALWRIGINVFVETFGSHRSVSLAADSARTNADIRKLWSRFMEKWVGHIAMVIETERSRGAAPVTLPADELSAALNLLNEKMMLSSFAGDSPSVPQGAAARDSGPHLGDQHLRRTDLTAQSLVGANICSCVFPAVRPPSCTRTSTRSMRPSSNATTPGCAAAR